MFLTYFTQVFKSFWMQMVDVYHKLLFWIIFIWTRRTVEILQIINWLNGPWICSFDFFGRHLKWKIKLFFSKFSYFDVSVYLLLLLRMSVSSFPPFFIHEKCFSIKKIDDYGGRWSIGVLLFFEIFTHLVQTIDLFSKKSAGDIQAKVKLCQCHSSCALLCLQIWVSTKMEQRTFDSPNL